MKIRTGLQKAIITVGVISLLTTGGLQSVFAETDTSTVSLGSDAKAAVEAVTDNYATYKANFESKNLAANALKMAVGKDIIQGSDSAVLSVMVSKEALYTVAFDYKPLGDAIAALTIDLKIDGANPFAEARRLTLPRIWKDAPIQTDMNGNQFVKEPLPYDEYYQHTVIDNSGWTSDPYLFYLTAGDHTVEITAVDGSFSLDAVTLDVPETAGAYAAPASADKRYSGDEIVIEGELPLYKNSYWLSAQSNTISTSVSPKSPYYDQINYIGGSNWSNAGETIVWETPELEKGYYQLGFSYMQDSIIGGSVYRALKIDGKTPFEQAKEIPFGYSYDFQKEVFSDAGGNPYLVYLSAGRHTLSLSVTPGAMKNVTAELNAAITEISDLYFDIIMVTGQAIDVSRDYELFNQVPDMENRLQSINDLLQRSKQELIACTGNDTGSQISTIDGLIRVIKEMLKNEFYAHKYVSNFYSNYCSVAATLNDLKTMPLSIDRLYLMAPETAFAKTDGSAFSSFVFSVKRFLYSFIKDYSNVADASNKNDSIEVWVNWGRDQAQVLNTLVQTSFTPAYDTSVNVKVVNASMVQAVLSGKGPDVFLQHSRSEPVNLAMRGVLYDLTQFEDIDEVLTRFSPDAELPYRYKDGLYALPDTQTFFMMYYRTDIFDKLGLSVPTTWEEFARVSTQLSRENLYTWIPYAQSNASTGVGSLSLFPSMVLQKGLSFYTEDQKATTLTTEPIIRTFTEWTDYYTKMKLPVTMSFYNRFRTGDCPLGIDIYTTYTTLKAAASEIDGLWDVSELPGTVLEDGTVAHTSSGGGTGCGILKMSKKPKAAWNFLKWWTSADIQLSYSNNVEAILGPSARVAVANAEAFEKMSWDVDVRDNILTARSRVREIPEIPGSYYLSRSIDHCFWNVVNSNKKPKDMLMLWGAEVDDEIARKWEQYADRK